MDSRNGRYFEEEAGKLDRWSEDLKFGLEREIKDLDREINATKQASRNATALEEKLRFQKQLRDMEILRTRKRREQYDAQDAIAAQRDELIERIEGQLRQSHSVEPLFTFRWTIQ